MDGGVAASRRFANAIGAKAHCRGTSSSHEWNASSVGRTGAADEEGREGQYIVYQGVRTAELTGSQEFPRDGGDI